MWSVMAVHSNYLVVIVHWWANNMKIKQKKKNKKKRKSKSNYNNRISTLLYLLRSKKVNLTYFIFPFIFYFIFNSFFNFQFLEQLGLGLIGYTVTSVTTWWHSHKTDYET